MNKDARVYVAGHRGLVGSAIWKRLQEKGYTNLVGKSKTELDLQNEAAVSDFFSREKPEYVILAAAKVGGIVANNTYRADFIFDNLQIQQNVIGQSYKSNVKKLLFLGSTCIYPKEAPQPIKENYLLTGPLEYTNEPYAIAKIAGLKMCESYNLQYGTNYLAVMPTNLYGPNDNFDLEKSHVLPALIRKFYLAKCLADDNWDAIKEDLKKRPIEKINDHSYRDEILNILRKYGVTNSSVEIWGTGKPMREFLWSEDMADACVFLMETVDFEKLLSEKSNEEKTNFHINIGTGKDITIHDLAEMIRENFHYKGAIKFNTEKPDGTMRKLTDVSKLNALGWRHTVEIEEGIRRIFDWYTNN